MVLKYFKNIFTNMKKYDFDGKTSQIGYLVLGF